MNKTAKILEKVKKLPCGLWIFSKIICFKAPYFSSISPVFTRLEPGVAEAKSKKRRKVTNHLGTFHAIAMCNLCEYIAGTVMEITVPNSHRWIPKSMQVKYLAKATTDLVAKTHVSVDQWPESGSVNVHVDAIDTKGTVVMTADIEMYISLKKPR